MGNYTKKIIGITGFSASGKSVLSNHLSEELSIARFSLGDYQRKKFSSYGTPNNYHKLLGLNVTYYVLWGEYINEIHKSSANKNIIVEGIYTSKFMELLLAHMVDMQSYIINVCAPINNRIRFFSDKTGLDWLEAEKQLFELDRIKMSVGIVEVIRNSDFTLTNNSNIKEFLRRGVDNVKSIMV